jgi:hypothetical protein
MNRYDFARSAAPGAAFGVFSYGTTLIIQYPATSFNWSFYVGPIPNEGGPTDALAAYLKGSGIPFNSPSYS